MAYSKFKPQSKREFYLDRLSMSLGSLANLYSNSPNPPSPDKLFEEAIRIVDKIWNYGQRFDSFPELEEKLQEHFEKEEHEKKVGRYNSSELWGLFNDRISPADYLKPRVFDEESKKKMYWGTIIHLGTQKLFNYEEKKYEIKIPLKDEEIVIVCKTDLELENGGLIELKTREDIDSFEELPSWYLYQCIAYLKAMNKKEMRLYLIGWAFQRRLFKVKFDQEIWDYIVDGIKKYHLRVVKANN